MENASSAISALVIGSGGFGRHYARLLAGLNHDALPGVPFIHTLILSRTDKSKAQDQASGILQSDGCGVRDVIGVKIEDVSDLDAILAKFQPGFIGIAARDRSLGDAVHPLYAARAVQYGAVLCEKPFCPAKGDGASLAGLAPLHDAPHAEGFGLDLPLWVVRQDLLNDPVLRSRVLDARKISIHWEVSRQGPADLLNDIALHPWSLIPDTVDIRIHSVTTGPNAAEIMLDLMPPVLHRTVPCVITLKTSGNRRTMTIDDLTLVFTSQEGRMAVCGLQPHVVQNSVPMLTSENPLKRQIIAVLKHRPMAGLDTTRRSQLFLEQLHGYQKATNGRESGTLGI